MTLYSFVNNLIGQARNYKAMERRLAKSPNLGGYYSERFEFMEEDLVEALTRDEYFESGPAERFAAAFMELVRTSTPARERKKKVTAG